MRPAPTLPLVYEGAHTAENQANRSPLGDARLPRRMTSRSASAPSRDPHGILARYGFEPLQTPAFERLDVLMGKYGEDGDKLIFKILRRGEHEASGEADLALRYDITVPLARVAAAYGSQLPSPYKRYALGLVWRAERPGGTAFASSCSATWTRSAPARRLRTRKCSAPTTTRWPSSASATSGSS